MAESDDYDEIFAALKYPVRRQILLLLEDKGEVSFTEIQNALGLNDTGLISYHLKELATLVEQSRRGKYSLSEVGCASLTLFRKVEMEKDKTSKAVHRELEKLLGEAVFLFFIFGGTLMVPLSVDITLSVGLVGRSNLSLGQVLASNFVGLLGMLLGVLLFIFYDRHYFTRNLKKCRSCDDFCHHSSIDINFIGVFPASLCRDDLSRWRLSNVVGWCFAQRFVSIHNSNHDLFRQQVSQQPFIP